MVRTVISLEPEDKRWLDERAAREKVPMTEIVRRAIRAMRERQGEDEADDFEALLDSTRGSWPEEHGDALEYQRRLRGEWDRQRE